MFDLLQEQFDAYYSQSHYIFNVDETATGAVPTRNSKVIACNV